MDLIELLRQISLFLSIAVPLLILAILLKTQKNNEQGVVRTTLGGYPQHDKQPDTTSSRGFEPLISVVIQVPKSLLRQVQLSTFEKQPQATSEPSKPSNQTQEVDVKIKEALDKTRRKRVEKAAKRVRKLIWREGESPWKN